MIFMWYSCGSCWRSVPPWPLELAMTALGWLCRWRCLLWELWTLSRPNGRKSHEENSLEKHVSTHAKKLPRPKHGLRELCLEKPNRLGNESGPKLHTLRAHHQECMFHMRIRPQKRALVAAPFGHKPTDSQMHSPLPNCLFLGRHVARKQARGAEPRVDYCSSNPRPPICD